MSEADEALTVAAAQRYSMLAVAVAGRSVVVGRDNAERIYTDGVRVMAPGVPRPDELDGIIVQASLIAAGSLAPNVVARLIGRRRLRYRYLTLEAQRAVRTIADIIPRRIVERVAAVYGGVLSQSATESLKRAQSGEAVPEAPEWLGTILPGKVLKAAPMISASGVSEHDRQQEADHREFDDEEESERSKLLDLLATPLPQNFIGRMLQNLLGMGSSSESDGGGGGSGDEGLSATRRTGRVSANATVVAGANHRISFVGPTVGMLYPEWDCHRQAFRADWCAVSECDPGPPANNEGVDSVVDHRLRREVAKLGVAYERHRRQPDGDTLDVTALIDFVVAKSSGSNPDTRVYEARRRTAHDLGVLIVLDATGSTDESDDHHRVFDQQRDVAARLTEVLDELGIRVATYGFRSHGRQNVSFLRVKGFDDRYDRAAQCRLAGIQPGGFTRLGAAVRHGAHLLLARSGAPKFLLVVVGDGLPYEDGYEGRYAQEDSASALREAVTAGVGCLCLSVRSSTDPEVLTRVWGHVPHFALERTTELAAEVGTLFRRALQEAAASRKCYL